MPELNTHSTHLVAASIQYWSITDAAQTGLDNNTDKTFEIWVKLAQLPSTSGHNFDLFNKSQSSSNKSYAIQINSVNAIVCFFWDSSFNQSKKTISGAFTAADVGNWVHLAMCFDISVPNIIVYKNGKDLGGSMDTTAATSIGNSASIFRIGTNNNNVNIYDGDIDEVRFWDVLRTGYEINRDRYKQLVGNESLLRGYWQFNNNGNDLTSNNNHLTNVNSATFASGQSDRPFGGDQIPAASLMGF